MTDPTSAQTMGVELTGAVATVTLLEPAMGPDFFTELPVVFTEIGADPAVRAIVLTGSNGQFSYGLDLKQMAPMFGDLLAPSSGAGARRAFHADLTRMQAAITAVANCPKPVVAAVSGWCIGGGVDLITAADVRVASADARFSVREARMAIVADIGSLQRLVGVVGDGHLRELALTGADIDADRARRIGLVNDVYDDPGTALAEAQALAASMAANSPLVLAGIKQVLDVERAPRVDAGLRHVAAWNSAFLPSNDLAEALGAFVERRPPEFTGD